MRLIKIILTIIIWCGGVMHPHANEVEYILVTNEKSDSVSLIDLTTLELIKEIKVGKRPRGLGLAPDKSEIYVAVSGENKIKVIETDNFQITRTFIAEMIRNLLLFIKRLNFYFKRRNCSNIRHRPKIRKNYSQN